MRIAALAYNLYNAYKLQNQSLSDIDHHQTAIAASDCAAELCLKG